MCNEICLTCTFSHCSLSLLPSLYISALVSVSHTSSLSYFPPPTCISICMLICNRESNGNTIPASCFESSSCFYIFIPFSTPPPHCPPLGICFCSSEEAHASSVWTKQQLSVPSKAKHVRRCLLEVALAQVSTSTWLIQPSVAQWLHCFSCGAPCVTSFHCYSSVQ